MQIAPNISKEPRGVAGGRVTAIRLREEALSRYYKNPNHCAHCGEVIHVRDSEKVSFTRKRKFCNRKCFGLNNRVEAPEVNCMICGQLIDLGRNKDGKIQYVKHCPKCKPIRYKVAKDAYWLKSVGVMTKAEVFSRHKNWQSGRTTIRKHAAFIDNQKTTNKQCVNCGYARHTEICHIKSVSSFSGDVPVIEINDPGNLVRLCPNCHWEFDNGLIKLAASVEIQTRL